MDVKSITVIGGSASTSIGLEQSTKCWPEIIKENFSDKQINHIVESGLTYLKAAKILSEIQSCDLLILQFSISIGWPRPIVGIWNKILQRTNSNTNEFWLDQPLRKYSGSLRRKILKHFLRLLRNIWKYVLFLTGLYRSKTSLREISDQIDLVKSLALQKSKYLIWIQLSPLMDHRIYLERAVHNRYFKSTIKRLKTIESNSITFLNLKSFSNERDLYTYDGVHLSKSGHKRVAEQVSPEISRLDKLI